MQKTEAKEWLKKRGLKNPPIDSGISGGGDAPRTYVADVMKEYAELRVKESAVQWNDPSAPPGTNREVMCQVLGVTQTQPFRYVHGMWWKGRDAYLQDVTGWKDYPADTPEMFPSKLIIIECNELENVWKGGGSDV